MNNFENLVWPVRFISNDEALSLFDRTYHGDFTVPSASQYYVASTPVTPLGVDYFYLEYTKLRNAAHARPLPSGDFVCIVHPSSLDALLHGDFIDDSDLEYVGELGFIDDGLDAVRRAMRDKQVLEFANMLGGEMRAPKMLSRIADAIRNGWTTCRR